MVTATRAWITAGVYAGWSVITWVWLGFTLERSKQYMYLRHCKDECYVEVEAEEDEAEEIPEDATTFVWDGFNW